MRISDGTGKNRDMKIDQFNRGLVAARTDIQEASRRGHAFSWTADAKDIDVDDTAILVANITNDYLLFIEDILVAVDVDAEVVVHCPAYPTLAGDSLTGVNLNRASGISPAGFAYAYGDETGNTQANIVWNGWVGAYGDNIAVPRIPLAPGVIILGYQDCVAVDIATEPSSVIATIIGYVEKIDS